MRILTEKSLTVSLEILTLSPWDTCFTVFNSHFVANPATNRYPIRDSVGNNSLDDRLIGLAKFATVTPAEKGCNKYKNILENWPELMNNSRDGTI